MDACVSIFLGFFLSYVSVHPWWSWRKWTAVAFMLIIQSFIWFKLTPTLILEVSCSNWTVELENRWGRINRKWHHCTTVSAKALVWCLGSQYHKNASSALLIIWYLLCSRAAWRKTTNERLRAPLLLDTEIWGLHIEGATSASEGVLLKPTYPNSLMWRLLTVFPVPGIATGVIVVIFIYSN